MAIKTLVKLMLALYVVLSFIRVSECIVGGRKAKKPPIDDPVVFINYAGRFARVEGLKDKKTGLYSFKGIRYADPPINENRFLRPKYRRLTGDVDAKMYGSPCPQPDYYDQRNIIGNEDCLTLNVFTPKMPDETSESAGIPVILFIHGGGYRTGSAAQYHPEPLTQNDIIFVPVQYRLGTLGILGDGTKEFGGNVALFDISAALRWIKEYISYFGGDPAKIKVMGHGDYNFVDLYYSAVSLNN